MITVKAAAVGTVFIGGMTVLLSILYGGTTITGLVAAAAGTAIYAVAAWKDTRK